MISVFVPSYGRPNATFLKRSLNHRFPMYVFVRKEELPQYSWIKSRPDTVMVALKNVHNIGQTRRVMLRYAAHKGIPKIFMIDDDVSRLDLSVWDEEKQRVRASGTAANPESWSKVLTTWENLWKEEALLGASYRPFSWSMRKDLINQAANAQLQQCVGVNAELLFRNGLNYRDSDEVGNEDLFLQLECITKGLTTARLNSIQYDCPAMGAGKGGCNKSEAGDIKQKQSRRVQLFLQACGESPFIRKGVTQSGVESIKFNWNVIGRN